MTILTQWTIDPNRYGDFEKAAYIRQQGRKGSQTRAAVFCIALSCAAGREYLEWTVRQQSAEMEAERENDNDPQ